MKSDNGGISVVLPAYNEEGCIGQFITDISQVLEEMGSEYEIVVVESGSTDKTAEIVYKRSDKNRHVKLIRQLKREGYGNALRLGIANTRHELIFYTDADRAIAPEDIANIISMSKDADVVIGHRTNREEDFIKRRIYSKIYNGMIHFLFGLKVKDVNFSCKLIKRRLLPNIRLRANGVFVDAELLAEVKKNNYTIKEVPITYLFREEGVSTLSRPSIILNIFLEMLIYSFYRFFSSN